MKTLITPGAVEALHVRIDTLAPSSHRRWGKMSVGGMLCHLNDAYAGLLRRDQIEEPLAPWAGRYLLRPFALHVPLRWPHGLPTPAEVDQKSGGTPPGDFLSDRHKLDGSLRRFADARDFDGRRHPIFGPMTEWEWMRWGWLHADHHLRQFSS